MKLKVVLFILTIISNFVTKLLNDKDTNLSENAVKSLSIISALLSSVVETPASLDSASSDFVELESWFLDHGVYLPSISDYTKTCFFYSWKNYCTSRLLDLTKYKKIKERFTLKDYD
jgi:hypothetical protein